MSAFLQNNQTVKCECTITNVGYTIFESTMSPKYRVLQYTWMKNKTYISTNRNL